jgi:hypothetical protein
MDLPDSELVILLGEATFHQLHGGIATNQSYRDLAQSLRKWEDQYQAIRHRPWRAPSSPKRTYIGTLPQSVLPHLARSIVEPVRGEPLGPSFDRDLWQAMQSARPSDPICAALVDLAESEFRSRRFQAAAAVARMARSRAPDEPAPQHLLAIAGAWLRDAGEPPDDKRAGFHLARAKAYRLLDDPTAAETEFRAALEWDAGLTDATSGLAEMAARGEGTPGRVSRSQAGSSASPPARQAIVVLGMHRSGTSALTGVLSKLGAAAPQKTLMGPDPCNQKGIFEALSLARAHDRFLAAAGSCWQDWRKFDLQWARSKAAAQHSENIKTVLIDEFGDEPMIVLKDPRICRLLPYTLSLLAELNVNPVAVLPVRNPLEVALSLQRRNNFTVPMSIMLWLRHVLDAEYLSRDLPRYFLSYQGLLQNWRYHVDRMAEQVGITWPDRSDRSAAEIDRFLTTELYHERATWDETRDHREVLELARHTYGIFMDICARGESKELRDRLDAARTEFDDSCQKFETPMATEDAAQSGSR